MPDGRGAAPPRRDGLDTGLCYRPLATLPFPASRIDPLVGPNGVRPPTRPADGVSADETVTAEPDNLRQPAAVRVITVPNRVCFQASDRAPAPRIQSAELETIRVSTVEACFATLRHARKPSDATRQSSCLLRRRALPATAPHSEDLGNLRG
jgi:hypothetical protein